MFEYIFVGGEEKFLVRLKGNDIFLNGRLTGGKWLLFCPKIFFPNRSKMFDAKKFLLRWPCLSIVEREDYLISQFGLMGYRLFGRRSF